MKSIATWSWVLPLAMGVVSLLVYRSRATHGPDMVGDEVAHILIPMLIALLLAIVVLFLRDPLPFEKYVPLLAVLGTAAASTAVYVKVIMR
ncbi:MAG: hypothetical protein U0992_17920 [Planctomycetaceae bacterium]